MENKQLKVVFHVNELAKWSGALQNIRNLLKEAPDSKIILVVNGEAISGYLDPEILPLIKELPQVGFHACNNALKAHQINPTALPAEVTVVAAGVLDLAQLQNTGYGYIKP